MTKRYRNALPSLLVVVLVGMFATPTLAQTAVLKGTVSAAGTGTLLAGAHVKLAAPGLRTYGAATNREGEFSIQALPAGTYSATVTFVGYARRIIADVTLEAGEEKMMNVLLRRTFVSIGEVTVQSVSRRPEKAVAAPAAVSVLEAADLAARPALTPAAHLRSMPAVDVISTGLVQNRVAVRGFNNVITGSDNLLILTDYRNTQVPSMRINNYQLIPTIDEDVERIEVVTGPGSALYGPNAAQGVVHIITKSPLDAQGTTVTAGAGERNLWMTSLRHAGLISPQIGYKVSARYYQGTDWEYSDPAEPDSILKGINSPTGRISQDSPVSNDRNPDIENFSLDTRVDFRLTPNLTATVTGGLARMTSLNLTSLGAFQHTNWTSYYAQGQLFYKNLFAQAFVVQDYLDDDNAYLMRNGDILIDKSRLMVAQVQHRLTLLDERQRLTYGADVYLTRPVSDFTINGRNEKKDDINEVGLYVQSETTVLPQIKLVAAARIDKHNNLNNPVLSPRAALVFSPKPTQSLRATYNRAFITPSGSANYLDLNIAPSLGPLPFAIQALGVPRAGYTFQRDAGGGLDGLYMQTPFAAEPAAYLPADATLMWEAVVAIMQEQGVDLSALPAPSPDEVGTALKILNLNTFGFDPISPASVANIAPLKPTITNTFEVGYKGAIGSKWLVTADVYHTKIQNFLSNLDLQTPNVFYDASSLTAHLANYMPQDDAAALAEGIASIPLGTLTPQEAGSLNPANLIFTYRNVAGSVALYGVDVSAAFYASPNWRFQGTYSYVSKDFFEKSNEQPLDLALNAPQHKAGGSVQYRNPNQGIDAQLRLRHSDGFRVLSGVYVGRVEPYTVLDLNTSWILPFAAETRMTLSVQNVLNNKHQEFVGVPEIGRLAMMQLSHTF